MLKFTVFVGVSHASSAKKLVHFEGSHFFIYIFCMVGSPCKPRHLGHEHVTEFERPEV